MTDSTGSNSASKPVAKKPGAEKPGAEKPGGKKTARDKSAMKMTAAEKSAVKMTAAVNPDPFLVAAPAAPAAPVERGATVDLSDETPPHGAQPSSPYGSLPAAPPMTLSVLALVFGIMGLILSFFLLGLLPAIGGVIVGHMALRREPHARGLAIGGLVTGYVGIAASVLFGLAILVPALLFFAALTGLGAVGFIR